MSKQWKRSFMVLTRVLLWLAVAVSGTIDASCLPHSQRSLAAQQPWSTFMGLSDHELQLSLPTLLWGWQHSARNLISNWGSEIVSFTCECTGQCVSGIWDGVESGQSILVALSCCLPAGAKLTLAPVVQNVGLKNPEIPFINAVMNVTSSLILCFVLVFPLKNDFNFIILTTGLSSLKEGI